MTGRLPRWVAKWILGQEGWTVADVEMAALEWMHLEHIARPLDADFAALDEIQEVTR